MTAPQRPRRGPDGWGAPAGASQSGSTTSIVTRPARRPSGPPGYGPPRAPRPATGRPPIEARRPVPAPVPRGRIKVVERFGGRRVRHRTGVFRRFRSLLGIMIIGIVIAAIVAAVVAVIVGAIALAIQHALGN